MNWSISILKRNQDDGSTSKSLILIIEKKIAKKWYDIWVYQKIVIWLTTEFVKTG